MLYRQNDPLPVYPLSDSYARLGQYMKRLERRSICSTWVREKKRDWYVRILVNSHEKERKEKTRRSIVAIVRLLLWRGRSGRQNY